MAIFPGLETISTFPVIFFLFFLSSHKVLSAQYNFGKIPLPPGVTGPESVGFDQLGLGPYVTVADGRILKWQGPQIGFVDFAYTSPQRTKEACDGTLDPNLWPICGRPLGISFSPTGILYIVDAYMGLLEVGPQGGLATQLATEAEGLPFHLLGGVDVDPITGIVYFQDASLVIELRNITGQQHYRDFSHTGRFMKYDPTTKGVTVLLSGLEGGGGPAVSTTSIDRFVLVTEFAASRIHKYWLTGPNANTDEIFMNLPGFTLKIKRTALGNFFIPVDTFLQEQQVFSPEGIRFDNSGTILETVSFTEQYFNHTLTVIQQHGGKLYVGSRDTDFIGVYTPTV